MLEQQWDFDGIGTRWSITSEVDDGKWTRLKQKITTRIAEFDQNYSRFRADSLVARMSRQAGTYRLPADGPKLLRFYKKLYLATGGLVTPLIGQAMADAGYDAAYSFASKPLRQPPRWDEAIELRGDALHVLRPALLDFGAAGKGYLVDIIGQLLADDGVRDFLINAGGDIMHRTSSGQAVRIGLEDPSDTSRAVGVARLVGGSLGASSGARRSWGGYHHILDPQKLASPREVLATWVVAGDTMTADGLATALFLVEPQQLASEFEFEYAVLGHDNKMRYSAGFPADMFSQEPK